MPRLRTASATWITPCLLLLTHVSSAQVPPYDVAPPAEPPYYRVRYPASAEADGLAFAVQYTLWIPGDRRPLRGVVIHQHGCGEGSCKSGLTGAYDLHWQALARKHDCALLAPAYEQPEGADCQRWCDPRNGSSAALLRALQDLGQQCGHTELSQIPWALWGHSGGGHWAGGMVLLHPDRVIAAWLRSGVPLLQADPNRRNIAPHSVSEAALQVPLMCNLGTKEGVSVQDGRFAGVWPANRSFFAEIRGRGGLIGVAIDPLTSHECGNQRYLAIPWLDACLEARLPADASQPLRPMPDSDAWLASLTGTEAVAAADYPDNPLEAGWLPNQAIAEAWMQYVRDTRIADSTPPPAPFQVRLNEGRLSWRADADRESGLGHFLILRDGKVIAKVPEQPKNPFGRPVFQGLQYSDTPLQPLASMQFVDQQAEPDHNYQYQVVAVNTVGLESPPSVPAQR